MRHSRECLTTVVRYSCERLTFVRVSHDVHANFIQFNFSKLSLEMVVFMSHVLSHCADRGNFLVMCLRMSAKGWRRVRDICDDLATVLR